MNTFSLPYASEVVIGSSEEADIRLTEPGIAPVHVQLHTGRPMSLRDANSGVPTVVGTRRLEPGETVPLAPGVVVLLGAVTLVVQASAVSTRLRHVRSHDYFEGRLEDECVRADGKSGTFAILRIQFERRQAQILEEAFTRYLRPVDLVAMYAADEYELLLYETSGAKARELAAQLMEHVKTQGVGELTMGLAAWPVDGRSPEALLAAAGAGIHGPNELPLAGSARALGAGSALEPLVERVAQTNINVLILGETGVGKEVLARRIHELSPRSERPLLCVNCAAISEPLLESELFGHERGAFTGAVQAKQGLLEVAEGGTVLLDEIGEMPLSIQAKLLRVVEQRNVTRVGGLKARVIDVRFMAATHRDLEALIAQGAFREDLYYRLNGVSLVVPPLRERREEIRMLAEAFVEESARRNGRPAPTVTSGAFAVLERYAWPGNIRELRNVMERAVMLTQSKVIDLVHLPLERLGRTLPHERVVEPVTPLKTLPFAPGAGAYSFVQSVGSGGTAEAEPDERTEILQALERCAGNQTHAARLLGISRRTLISRIERYDLPRPRKRGAS
jgi:DNA-binding NtrC family response regulator